jgi:hypothetical protein
MNLPTIWGLKTAVNEYRGQWDVWINHSGDTLPVYKPHTLAERLQELPYNFMTSAACETGLLPTSVYDFPSWWHKRAHYTIHDTEPDPVFHHQDKDRNWYNQSIVTYFGSQWMVLQPSFCEWFVEQLQRTDSLVSLWADYLKTSEKLMTDETFFSSLLMQVNEFSNTLPKFSDDGHLLWKNGSASNIVALRYERMDEHVPTSRGYFPTDQRYEVPGSPSVEASRPWGPYFLGVYDLGSIRESGALFVRKVSTHIDPNMVSLLPVDREDQIPLIHWPEEVKMIPKPDWEQFKAKVLAETRRDENEEEDEL